MKKDNLFTPRIVYSPKFSELTGNINAGLLLGWMIQECEKAKKTFGWICQTRIEIQKATFLTRREQEAASATLRNLGILEEKKKGLPSKIWYRATYQSLFEAVEAKRFNPPRTRKNIGSIYLAKSKTFSGTKIGFSYKPSSREVTLQEQNPEIFFEWISQPSFTVKDEKKIHDKYAEFRIRGEWFALDENQIEEIKRSTI